MREEVGGVSFSFIFLPLSLSVTHKHIKLLPPSPLYSAQVDWLGGGGRDALLAGCQLLEQGLG